MMRMAALVVLALLQADAWAQGASWKAGAAKATVTPGESMWMSGYGARTKPSEGKETELWAKALVLEDGRGQRAVLVTLDFVGIARAMSQEICQSIERKHGVPRSQIALSVSHTHCGPVLAGNLSSMYFLDDEQTRRVNDYSAKLPGRVLAVVDEAVAKLKPATLAWGIGEAGFGVNRRENKEAEVPQLKKEGRIKGPNDHDVPVLAVKGADGRLVAVAFGYACHATVLSFQKWCGDYPGFAMTALEESHPGAVALFWAGCGADQNPLPRRTVELARGYGKELADSVDAALRGMLHPLTPRIQASYEEIDLPLAEVPSREQLVKDAESTNKFIANRARMLLEELKQAGQVKGRYPYPVQVWRLGDDVTWVTLGGEVVVDYALRLKKELDPGHTWVMGYANDVMAYIPSLRVLREGGYEGATAMIYYGLASPWGPRVEELIVDAVHRGRKKVGE